MNSINGTSGAASPTISPPGPGLRFEDWVDATNVFDAIERTQQRCGAKTAITFVGTDPNAPPRQLNYTELVEGIARTANAFRSLGLRRGDVVAYLLPSLVETQFVLWGAATAMSANGFRAVIDTDLVGTFNTLRAAHEFLRKRSALVLAISAVQSSMPTYAQAHVCAAKAGIDMLIRTLAVEWADDGIRCVGIAPGPVADTEGMARLAPQGQQSWDRLLRAIPSGRGASKQEIADLALYLASDSGRYINGVVIPIDGGFSAVGSLEFGRMLKDSVTQPAGAAA